MASCLRCLAGLLVRTDVIQTGLDGPKAVWLLDDSGRKEDTRTNFVLDRAPGKFSGLGSTISELLSFAVAGL